MAAEPESARAFRELLGLLRDADATFRDGPRVVDDPIAIADGYRHLTHLLGYGLDLYLEAIPSGRASRPSRRRRGRSSATTSTRATSSRRCAATGATGSAASAGTRS